MFDEVDEIIEDYDRDKRSRAEELYGELFQMLQALDIKISELHDNHQDRPGLLTEMKEIAALMQALNYAVCQFEHEKVSDLADDCPGTYGYGSHGGLDTAESEESLRAWLMLHFPHTWPR